ncbi:transcription factor IIA, alpha/beta subunit [Micromonas pusilla CCMP1545]|uniref:Transcription factor IIA, alpha/beta subunit n=1 Tax=Micromonas pusilla (strain CCMP1545) TaxID=564608 RepID=C1MKV2_MICPC|nr:transcription factor IIA, alpha/beta subunit [Micromonas pusilla CCMP1545]EEH59827.1 transcription factor IIA, alpha/beta subunit [Micromonas pusilla CCMP1545]|eukprot:XP_003056451.1 transcription factor IIA, alpha/beta subunit [Micromonas pusilla CCMP1545]
MDVASLYLQVMNNVIDGVRGDFSSEQLDESVLESLASLWERKLLQSGSSAPERETNNDIAEKAVDEPGLVHNEKVNCSSEEQQISSAAVKGLKEDSAESLSSDSDEGLVDLCSSNLVLAQYDKVTRAKNKWKCTLKKGVMTLDGKDVLFGKASGEFLW